MADARQGVHGGRRVEGGWAPGGLRWEGGRRRVGGGRESREGERGGRGRCDKEILRALANEAGWIVEPDGTTYRKEAASEPDGGASLSSVPITTQNGSPPQSMFAS
ncbi:protein BRASSINAZOLE-RESISTANT 1-like [Panicum miliaceum]|uniref:Protein BZR1 homolog n=1 Tax=Panicum miliaceum TaxID=4540 RepID=A0A3L6RPT1_PANMI|nr:protein BRASSINAZOLE-RESISTANT 1-like [Panicum miliaceum]